MSTITRHFHILWRTEALVAKTRMRLMSRSCVLYGFAAVVALFGLGMLNVAMFVALTPIWGSMRAALAAALGDFGLALAVIGIALIFKPRADLNAALELRRMAIEGLEAELNPIHEGIARLAGVVRDPADALFARLLVPIVTAFIRTSRKSDKVPPA